MSQPGRVHRSIPGAGQHRVVEGLERLLPVLSAMETKASRRVLRGALRAGLTVIRRSVVKEIPRREDGSKRARFAPTIGTHVGKDREQRIAARVGIFIGAARKRKSKENWWVGVFATGSQRRRTKRGAERGRIAQEDFVQRGYTLAAFAAQGRIGRKAHELIDKEILKARR